MIGSTFLRCGIVAIYIAATAGSPAQAQSAKFPSASRTIFKCMVDGKATYSDSPCLGAERLDIVPTRGMNKSTGRELTGADVTRERHSEMMSEALRPLTGMNIEQHAVAVKRYRLPYQAQLECRGLDTQIAREEVNEKEARGTDKAVLQRLLQSRARFREIGC